jgi:hypothetical protein
LKEEEVDTMSTSRLPRLRKDKLTPRMVKKSLWLIALLLIKQALPRLSSRENKLRELKKELLLLLETESKKLSRVTFPLNLIFSEESLLKMSKLKLMLKRTSPTKKLSSNQEETEEDHDVEIMLVEEEVIEAIEEEKEGTIEEMKEEMTGENQETIEEMKEEMTGERIEKIEGIIKEKIEKIEEIIEEKIETEMIKGTTEMIKETTEETIKEMIEEMTEEKIEKIEEITEPETMTVTTTEKEMKTEETEEIVIDKEEVDSNRKEAKEEKEDQC